MNNLKQQLEAVGDRMAEEHFKKTGWAPTEGYVLNYQAGFNAAIPIILKAVEQRDYWNGFHPDKDYSTLENQELLNLFADGGK